MLVCAALPGLSSLRRVRTRSAAAPIQSKPKGFPYLECVAVGVALFLFGLGISVHKDLRTAQANQASALATLDSLAAIHSDLSFESASTASSTLSTEIFAKLTMSDLALAKEIELAIANAPAHADHAQIALTRLTDKLNVLRGEVDGGLLLIGQKSRQLVLIFFFGALFAAGSIVGLRNYAAYTNSERKSEDDAKPLIAHAPVGLFGYRNGKCLYANAVLRTSFDLRKKPDKVSEIFPTRTEPSHQELLELLDSAEENRKPFCLTVKVISDTGGASYYEARGMPFYNDEGHFKRMNVFVIDISRLYEAKRDIQFKNQELESKNQLLSSALAELESNLESVVKTLVRAVEAKDPYTAGHSERVGKYAGWIGEKLGLGPYELRMLELGCLIHDVGKIGIPDELLLKPETLSDEEFEVIKLHPVHGAKMIETVGIFQECLPIVRWHHERLDGSGYPDGLSGAMIPLSVRIATVADVFDAVTSKRSYRDGVETGKAMDILKKEAANGQLDPIVVQAFEEVIAEKGIISDSDTNAA